MITSFGDDCFCKMASNVPQWPEEQIQKILLMILGSSRSVSSTGYATTSAGASSMVCFCFLFSLSLSRSRSLSLALALSLSLHVTPKTQA